MSIDQRGEFNRENLMLGVRLAEDVVRAYPDEYRVRAKEIAMHFLKSGTVPLEDLRAVVFEAVSHNFTLQKQAKLKRIIRDNALGLAPKPEVIIDEEIVHTLKQSA